jgi:cytochrome c oxidase subunit 2
MDRGFRLFPEQASTFAPRVDALYYYLLAVSAFFTLLIATLIIYFAIKYRRGSRANRVDHKGRYARWIEFTYIGIPLVLEVVMFVWAARLFFEQARPPDGAMEIHVVAKQWMWKFQHPSGKREINELHVPTGQPIKLTMISQDVIHSLFVPDFRVKHDVLPGRYVAAWFEATEPGEYYLFCAEYCGTDHSRMGGRVVVQRPSEYQAWLAGGAAGQTPLQAGQQLFEQLRCENCHRGGAQRGPALENLYGAPVRLTSGETVIADDNYLRESILRPAAKVVIGYEPIMPTFEGQISEEGLIELLAYIKSLTIEQRAGPEQPPAKIQDQDDDQ